MEHPSYLEAKKVNEIFNSIRRKSNLPELDDPPAQCPECGSYEEIYGCEEQARDHWLGLGPEGPCWACGADYEHHHPSVKKPLVDWEKGILIQTLKQVDEAYKNPNLYMTPSQIDANRSYYVSITLALLLPKNLYHMGNRAEITYHAKQKEKLRSQLEELLKTDVAFGKAYKTIADEAGGYTNDQLTNLVNRMKRDLRDLNRNPPVEPDAS